MGELDEKLNAILGNQEAMGQIMALAQSLGASGALGGQGNQDSQSSQPASPGPALPSDPLSSSLGELDPRLMQLGMKLIQEYQRGDDQKTALLTALRPFVKEERYAKLDRAIQVARLSRVIRVLFETMRKEGEQHV